jgi:ubiquinone/menaquinone biosynthesis C-methylase UbiE
MKLALNCEGIMKEKKFDANYYAAVEAYYDADAIDFEKRYWQNPVLRKIRQDFREEVKRHKFNTALEIGYGPGFDLVHFAQIFPDQEWFGIDISPEMQRISDQKIMRMGLQNAKVFIGSVEDVKRVIPNQQFEMIFVFFGALNTVKDLKVAVEELHNLLAPNGKMVITFVNKWFLQGMLIELLKGKFRSAFSRLQPIWGGYSPTKHLDSKCYSNAEIRMAFNQFEIVGFRGYSICFPAWYYQRLAAKIPVRLLRFLWSLDHFLGSSLIGNFGEYTRYTFKKLNQDG